MSIYVIGDLHLSLDGKKSMDVFGGNWEGYIDKIKNNWSRQIKEEDTIIIDGDFCWSMDLKDTYDDFKFIEDLPRKQNIVKR